MNHACTIAIAIALAAAPHRAAAQTAADDAAAREQWFTGTLEAPSPALPKAGSLVVKPFALYTRTTGSYDEHGAYHALSGSDAVKTIVLVKYALSDRISVQVLPTLTHLDTGAIRYTGIGDLPIEAEYRVTDGSIRTGRPSLTLAFGITLPTGRYDDMATASSGFGAGAFQLKQQVLLQSLFNATGGHPTRLRAYLAITEPIGCPTIHNISAYGTTTGFVGRVDPGLSGVLGVGGGYALDRNWVVAFDLVYKDAQGAALDTIDAAATRRKRRATLALAPALEYNVSSHFGLIAGVDVALAGHNSAAYFAPQLAVSLGF